MNELGIRKLPRDDDGPDLEKETTDEDSDFEEGYRKKQKKPIMLKIKKDAEADGNGDGVRCHQCWFNTFGGLLKNLDPLFKLTKY